MTKVSTPMRILIVAALVAAPMFSTATADASGGWVRTTRISLHGPTHVARNTSFRLWGNLDSGKRYCRSHSTIELRKASGKTVATTKTNASGHFSFTTKIGTQTTFKAFFPGKQKGVHPNIKTCTNSTSYHVTVGV